MCSQEYTNKVNDGRKLDNKELVSFKKMLIANSIQVDALAQLLIEKGLITAKEFFTKLKQVQAEYERRKSQTNESRHDFLVRDE